MDKTHEPSFSGTPVGADTLATTVGGWCLYLSADAN
jgi:hypothetical protein